jgi:hypothetical protein
MVRTISILSVLMIIAFACSKNSNKTVANIDCTTAKSFASDVTPVIQSSCSYSSGCHANGSINGPGPLTSYQQVFNNRAAIRSAVVNGTMPQQGSLSSSALSAIVCWIDAGAANN